MKYFIVISFIFIAAISNAQQKYRIVAERTFRYNTAAQEYILYDLVTYSYKHGSSRGLSPGRDTVLYDTMRHYSLQDDKLKLKNREDMIYRTDDKIDTAYSGIAEGVAYKPLWRKVFRYNDRGQMVTNSMYVNIDMKDDVRQGIYGTYACRYRMVQQDSFVYARDGKQVGIYKLCYRPNCQYQPAIHYIEEGDTLMLTEQITYAYNDAQLPNKRYKKKYAGYNKYAMTYRAVQYNEEGNATTYSTYDANTMKLIDTLSRMYKDGKHVGDEMIEWRGNNKKWTHTTLTYDDEGREATKTWQVEWHRLGTPPSKDTAMHVVAYSYNANGQKTKEHYRKYTNKHNPEPQEEMTRTYTYTSAGYLQQEDIEQKHNTPRGKDINKYKATYEYEAY